MRMFVSQSMSLAQLYCLHVCIVRSRQRRTLANLAPLGGACVRGVSDAPRDHFITQGAAGEACGRLPTKTPHASRETYLQAAPGSMMTAGGLPQLNLFARGNRHSKTHPVER